MGETLRAWLERVQRQAYQARGRRELAGEALSRLGDEEAARAEMRALVEPAEENNHARRQRLLALIERVTAVVSDEEASRATTLSDGIGSRR